MCPDVSRRAGAGVPGARGRAQGSRGFAVCPPHNGRRRAPRRREGGRGGATAACGLQASHVPPSCPPLLCGEARPCGRVLRGGSCRQPPPWSWGGCSDLRDKAAGRRRRLFPRRVCVSHRGVLKEGALCCSRAASSPSSPGCAAANSRGQHLAPRRRPTRRFCLPPGPGFVTEDEEAEIASPAADKS